MAAAGTTDRVVDISVVIPVYQSEATLVELYGRVSVVLDSMTDSWELVLVNDGSSDGSWQKLGELSRSDRRVVSIDLQGNFGQHNALMCGLKSSKGRCVVTMDDDLQHPPEEIPRLWNALASTGADAVLGSYESTRQSSFRKAGSFLAKQVFFYLLGIPRALDMTSFRIIRREVVDRIVESPSLRPRVGLILFSVTGNVTGVVTEHHARAVGRSGYSISRLAGDFTDNILNYSPRLLRHLGLGGLILLTLAAGLAVSLLGTSGDGARRDPGLTLALLAVLGFFGMVLMAGGMLGELRLKRMFAGDRPQYLVAETLNLNL